MCGTGQGHAEANPRSAFPRTQRRRSRGAPRASRLRGGMTSITPAPGGFVCPTRRPPRDAAALTNCLSGAMPRVTSGYRAVIWRRGGIASTIKSHGVRPWGCARTNPFCPCCVIGKDARLGRPEWLTPLLGEQDLPGYPGRREGSKRGRCNSKCGRQGRQATECRAGVRRFRRRAR